jgi:FkbM family methyltransferase
VIDNFPYIQTLIQTQIARLDVKTIADVGAYLGNSSIWLARKYRRIDVHAIEPHAANCVELRKLKAGLDNYHVHEMAISNKNGPMILYAPRRDDDAPAQNATLYKEGVMPIEVMIHSDTLASFCEMIGRLIDILILNCEGAEYVIFEDGAAGEVLRQCQLIDLSLHGKTFKYLSKEYAKKKLAINNRLVKWGFVPLYGQMIESIERLPTGHIRQLWVRQ